MLQLVTAAYGKADIDQVAVAKTNAAGTLSRKSVRTVRRSLFRKVSSSWSRSAGYSRTHPIQPLRFRKLPGDTPFGEPFG